LWCSGRVSSRLNSVWATGFVDHEQRSKLIIDPDGIENDVQKNTSGGFAVGRDWAVQYDQQAGRGSRFGLFGGLTGARTTTDAGNFQALLNKGTPSLVNFQRGGSKQELVNGFLGLYGSYFTEHFSTDFLFQTGLSDSRQQDILQAVTTTSCDGGNAVKIKGFNQYIDYTLAANAKYSYELGSGEGADERGRPSLFLSRSWLEPLAGFRYTYTNFLTAKRDNVIFDNVEDPAKITSSNNGRLSTGLTDGQVLRLQTGLQLRNVTLMPEKGLVIRSKVAGLIYSDVLVSGFKTAVSSATNSASSVIAQDEGKIRGLARFSVEAEYQSGLSFNSAFEVRGGEDYFGVGAKAGFKVKW